MLLPWLLLAAPVVAALLFVGQWAAFAVCALVALVEFQSFRRTEQFSARVWRAVGRGAKGRQAQAAEVVYLLTAAAGVLLFVLALATTLA